MSDNKDIRWLQRLQNFQKALAQLQQAAKLSQERELSNLETQGLIKTFEFTHELAWNVLKDFFAYQGNTAIMGSKDATREAFQKGIISDGDTWMEMIKSRNQSSHTYNESTATDITQKIVKFYLKLFENLSSNLIEINANTLN